MSNFFTLEDGGDLDSVYLKEYELVDRFVGGSLWGWGDNFFGQLNTGDSTNRSSPVRIGMLTDWKFICNNAAIFGIKNDGTLWSWGKNDVGQLGLGDTTNRNSPVKVGTDTNWKSVTVDILIGTSTLAIKTDGTLWSWGYNDKGQLGQGNIYTLSSPVKVGTDTNWKSVICTQAVTLALKDNGTLWSWGNNTSGELGNGTSGAGTERSSPVQVGSLSNWASIYKSYQSCMAIKTDGTLWTWGYNAYGNLGLGDTTVRSSPVQVTSSVAWKRIWGATTSSLTTMYGIKIDGTLWACGYNTNGDLGLGDTNHKSIPVQIGTLNNWKYVNNGLAIKTDGTLWGWGVNSSGRLGLGDTTSRSSPVQVGTLNNWVSINRSNESIAIRLETGV